MNVSSTAPPSVTNTATVTGGGDTNTSNNAASDATPIASATSGTIAFVQANYATPQTAQIAIAVPYTAAQTAGNLNVVVAGWNDATAHVRSVADSRGNTYALAVGPSVQAGLATQSIYYAKNIVSAAASANTVTVTFDAAASYGDIRIAEYSGLDRASPLDVVAAAIGNGTTINSGAVTTTSANDLLVGANLVQTPVTGPGPGYTERLFTVPDADILEDRVVTIATMRCRCQAQDVPGFHLGHHALEGHGGNVVAFVDDDVAVRPDDVVHAAFADQALDHGDIDRPGDPAFASADAADGLLVDA